ncbi:MAG TPA: YajQ family cyclic di-GMP-binding protein [Leptospiraceae bacterium]|nr:YajQ family cyclic di-GMP-binding protein [Leptospiraceae bacterium]HMX32498.1 YajQ family cyclic di-GMP-binding protein [Leptospiraceae bacterium]HMY30232.1 YajQ family cyclic di-GMP-binding protein [Leptospiraceae bacterium]HMZ66925.1 YajQ family cyclic di-GMP-binding protein [Leptospiraceae bacterium]HNA07189.1 YajQ family cyclic di-GMP-binding protein [Leptospiraceae bacterium]
MAQDPSFDIISKVEKSELANAVTQALSEINTRFDFKGSKSDIKVEEENLVITSDNDIKIKQVIDVLINKLAKRGVGLKAFNFDSKIESATGNTARMKVKIQQGLEKEHTKEIVRIIKDSKLKVQAAIMGDYVRVTGKKKDDLQEVQHLLKKNELNFDFTFTNYKG